MKRFKAKFKREKCRYKRCSYKRTHPVDNPRYCAKHVDIVGGTVTMVKVLSEPTEFRKPTLAQKLRALIFVDK